MIKRVKKVAVVSLLLSVGFLFIGCIKEVVTPPIETGSCDYNTVDPAGWTKVFEDNFDSDLATKWDIWNSGAYNNELQFYQSANMTFDNGILVIKAKKETKYGPVTPGSGSNGTFKFTSGRIESKTNFSCNSTTPKIRFSARIKLPSGTGMWPAFWSYGASWPTNGEIDFLEAKGSNAYQYSTNYFYGNTTGQNLVSGASTDISTTASLTDCYHVYECIWTQNKLSFYLDGKLVDEKTGGYVSSMFNKTQHVTFNLAVGGDYFNGDDLTEAQIQPGTMYVDWVRVYTAQ